FAHLGEEVEEHGLKEECSDQACFAEDTFSYSFLAAGAMALLAVAAAFYAIFGKRLGQFYKRLVFALMGASAVSAAAILFFTIAYPIYFSASHGNVHWHADYGIWICGERMHLEESESRIGTPLLHHHNDNRIHVEGVVYKTEDISLGKFFEAIGGHLDNESLKINLLNGSAMEVKNGDLCNGTLRMHANGKENFEFGKFVITPYSTVPPGDVINITFG
ncbi:MAG: hypothetical protein QMD85_01395, partial [Candidatus Aenigmarchaeota archaeon]|nr:hypothetical protein [Candidatus Aenigmarchaeota archaeon]